MARVSLDWTGYQDPLSLEPPQVLLIHEDCTSRTMSASVETYSTISPVSDPDYPTWSATHSTTGTRYWQTRGSALAWPTTELCAGGSLKSIGQYKSAAGQSFSQLGVQSPARVKRIETTCYNNATSSYARQLGVVLQASNIQTAAGGPSVERNAIGACIEYAGGYNQPYIKIKEGIGGAQFDRASAAMIDAGAVEHYWDLVMWEESDANDIDTYYVTCRQYSTAGVLRLEQTISWSAGRHIYYGPWVGLWGGTTSLVSQFVDFKAWSRSYH